MKKHHLTLTLAFSGMLGLSPALLATSYTYDGSINAGLQDGGGSGWNTSNSNWWDGAANLSWPDLATDSAVFGATSTTSNATVNVSTVQTNNITFASLTSGNYILAGGTITLAGTTPSIIVNNTQGNNSSINSTLIATTGFSKSGSGSLSFGTGADLSGVSGTINLSQGNVFLNSASAGSAAAAWNIAASGINLGLGANATIHLGSLSGVTNSVLRTGGSFSPTASIGSLNTDTTFSGKVQGTIAITKVGTGTLTLAGASSVNTYTGATTINAGTLALASGGGITKTSAITVGSGAIFDVSAISGNYTVGSSVAQTLKGSGVIDGSITIEAGFGSLVAGDVGTVGTLTFNDNLILAGSTSLDLVGVTNGTYDKISVGNTFTAGGALTLAIDNGFAAALNDAGGSVLLTLFNVSSASNFASIGLTGLESGTFATTTAGSSFLGGSSGITYTWIGDGTLAVSATMIPEPSTYAAFLGLGSLLIVTSIRRRRLMA